MGIHLTEAQHEASMCEEKGQDAVTFLFLKDEVGRVSKLVFTQEKCQGRCLFVEPLSGNTLGWVLRCWQGVGVDVALAFFILCSPWSSAFGLHMKSSEPADRSLKGAFR
jgi:hypothetical protein